MKSMLLALLLLPFLALASPNLDDAFSSAHNASLLWGPYRPNLYFGIRPRLPHAILTSLIWSRVDQLDHPQRLLRHTCEQGDMGTYGWVRYDPRLGGVQVISDPSNGINLEIQWVKNGDASWGTRIRGAPIDAPSSDNDQPEDIVRTTLVWGLATEGPFASAEVELTEDYASSQDISRGIEGDVVLRGHTQDLGDFKMVVTKGKGVAPHVPHEAAGERPLNRSFVASRVVPPEHTWQSKALLFNELAASYQSSVEKYGENNLPPPWQLFTLQPSPGSGNYHHVQKTFQGSFEFDVLFGDDMTSEKLTSLLDSAVKQFDSKFDKVFKPQGIYADKQKYADLSRSLFSNLLGGIGYFHGDQKIDRTYAPEYDEHDEDFWEEAIEARNRVVPKLEGPSTLFTSIPSRPFFPRGFLWDEGFHLLPVMDWDIDLALDIVRSWFSHMDDNGWIPREVILGAEARSKVPDEFQVQYPHYANPPTLFLILLDYVERLEAGQHITDPHSQLLKPEHATAYLKSIYPLAKLHYEWFRRTQRADFRSFDRSSSLPVEREAYRWRGRTPLLCLTSGLDDYPRAQPPHPGEMHIDALSWVGLMSGSLRRLAAFLGEHDDAKLFESHERGIKANVATGVFWDDGAGVWCDTTIDDFEEEKRICHVGYVSLMPWILGLIDSSDNKNERILGVLQNAKGLWSKHGIRSLSMEDANYGTNENYWRSPIWININFLIVDRLRQIGIAEGPYRQKAQALYDELRRNVIDTVSDSWDATGFAWEQYNPETGAGQRTQHFTGWTSLVVKLMALPEFADSTQAKAFRHKDEL